MLKYHREYFTIDKLGENNIDRLQVGMTPPKSRGLEIGCATGYMSDFLVKEKHCFVIGVELDAEQAAVAASRCSRVITDAIDATATWKCIDSVVEESGRFEIIFMSQVIEHPAEPTEILKNLHDWLPPEGALVISTCNIVHWKSRLRLFKGDWQYEEYGIFDLGHLRFFTPNSFVEILASCKILFDKRLLAPSDLLRLIPFVGKTLRQKYIIWLRNLIATQFVYRAIRNAC